MCGKRTHLQVDAVPGHDERNSWSVAKRLSAVTLRPKQQENIALPKAVWLYKEFSGFRT